ncbi:hypothetical protein ABZX38_17965 [Streptomyces longwoodensis]|uniref:hypothetical protein n=1 Tax=Streptomyces longwoodensis TaxID=68231 RepID=UPI0033B9797E
MVLTEALQADSEQLTGQLRPSHRVFYFGGKDNTYERCLLNEFPTDAKKSLMSEAGVARMR